MNSTHEVFNQPAALSDYNLFDTHRPLRDALKFNAPTLDTAELSQLGAALGSTAMQTHARLANVHGPVLHSHDRFGRRVDQVEFHPSYHALMRLATSAGLHGTPWGSPHPSPLPGGEGTRGEAASSVLLLQAVGVASPNALALPLGEGRGEGSPHVARAAGFMLFTELEPSTLCPISMTYAATPALRGNTAIYADWGSKLASRSYDPELKLWQAKAGLTMGMGMTEKQGGSDVRANTTRAEPAGRDGWGERYAITGHKWFFSAPMCDAFLVLAQTKSGLSCFFLPRVLPDGSLNAIRIQRLKDKLGNKANASSEVEFENAQAWLVGDEGRGIPQILEMGTMTRLDCALGTSGLMRQALALALNHTSQRKAFGKLLIDQPLMRNVLADLALESEAATALAIRLARAFDRPGDTHEAAMARLLTPVAKFWICKRGSHFAQEAMECLGGNGYVEEGGEGVMARVYREMPLNSIWEGAGNIMALDLLRALRKADAVAALTQELAAAKGAHPALDRLAAALPTRIEEMANEVEARRLAQDVALAVQAALLLQTAPAAVFSAFCDSRIAGNWGQSFGTLGAGTDFDTIITRAMPR
jgi:putative acyl-CoA dehydrogenase